MAKGYPTRSGIYWVRMYEWNGDTRLYDIENNEWMIALVDTDDPLQYQVQIIGSDEPDDVRHIFEYQRIGRPQ